jgi:hypothetical protein
MIVLMSTFDSLFPRTACRRDMAPLCLAKHIVSFVSGHESSSFVEFPSSSHTPERSIQVPPPLCAQLRTTKS